MFTFPLGSDDQLTLIEFSIFPQKKLIVLQNSDCAKSLSLTLSCNHVPILLINLNNLSHMSAFLSVLSPAPNFESGKIAYVPPPEQSIAKLPVQRGHVNGVRTPRSSSMP